MKWLKSLFRVFYLLPRNLVLLLIKGYQKTLSPDHSPFFKKVFPYGYCKYTPSCSDYAHASVKKNGAIIGSLKAIWRILRCNPWSKGGYDPPR